jgi:hypothetical protein
MSRWWVGWLGGTVVTIGFLARVARGVEAEDGAAVSRADLAVVQQCRAGLPKTETEK